MSNQLQLNSLSDVLAFVQSDPPPHQLALQLRTFAKRDVGETILGSATTPEGLDPLSLLNVQTHTLAIIFLLSARLSTDQAVSFEFVSTFCEAFDPAHARYAPERVTMLARGIAYTADRHNHQRVAIGPLRSLLARYAPSSAYLTSMHCIFLRVCLKSQCWTQAVPVLSVPLTEVDKNISDVGYLDNLTYFYLGGVIWAALKRFAEAEEFFETAACVPGAVVSAVQVEALKKLTLVQLILHGKTKSLPKYASSSLNRIFKQTPYHQLARNYPGSLVGLSLLLEKEAATFSADGNVGLIKQVLHHAPRWIVRRLTDTYTTLSLREIAQAIGTDAVQARSSAAIEEATLLILGMIEREEIFATITPSPSGDPAAASVTFRDPPPPKYFDPAILEQLLSDAQTMSAQLSVNDRVLGKSKAYLSKAVKDREPGGGGMGVYDDLDGEMVYGEWD